MALLGLKTEYRHYTLFVTNNQYKVNYFSDLHDRLGLITQLRCGEPEKPSS